jgi:ketosteroid isomerase-like protein
MTDAPAPTAPYFQLVLNVPREGGLTDEARRNREILAEAYRATLAGNPNALTELLDPDVKFYEAAGLPYGVEAIGITGALKGVAAMFGAWTHLRCEFQEYLAGGDLVIAYMWMTGTARATGQIYEGPNAELWRFKNGKVIEWRPIYWDTHRVRQVCGLA